MSQPKILFNFNFSKNNSPSVFSLYRLRQFPIYFRIGKKNWLAGQIQNNIIVLMRKRTLDIGCWTYLYMVK